MSFLRNRLALVAVAALVSCGTPSSVETTPSTRENVTSTTIDEREHIEAVRLYQAVALYTATERWEATRLWLDALEAAEQAERRERPEPPRSDAGTYEEAPAVSDWPVSLQPCGGDLPPCYVKQRESGGDYGAVNPTGCGNRGCYGAWQFSGEWACKLGLPCDLLTATPEQQDNAARILFDGGCGGSNWAVPEPAGC